MIEIRETTEKDLKNIQSLWADGEVMRYVGFPDGLHEDEEYMKNWLRYIRESRPMVNHYSIYDNGDYCGETFYSIDKKPKGQPWILSYAGRPAEKALRRPL